MKIKYSFLLATVFLLSSTLFAAGTSVDELAVLAVSETSSTSKAAITELRKMGNAGLDALFVKYAADIDGYTKTGEADENWKRVASALDTVAMQKDVYTSHLFWYTDLDQAKKAAKLQNKPILSLRLLGNLNEEFSCANSRLFRAVLYSNADISKYLRDNYILHWKSVRPAPRITIDFGDGRKIERTITGNSVHYILSSDGSIIDAIPGLYSPVMFLDYIAKASEINKAVQFLSEAKRQSALMKYRKASFDQIIANRKKTVETAGVDLTETKSGTLAILAAPMAVSKAIVVDEYSILRVFDDFAKFEPSIKFDDWSKLADVYVPRSNIDADSIALVRRQNRKTGLTEDEFKALFAKLDNFVAIDSTRNDFLYHTKLYEWLNRRFNGDLEALNARVYDQIFQTPNHDKWLGLYSNDVYTALDGNGIVK
ncbi:MAG: hypothetical protein IPL32_04745 [Chloracidobacterium sp.]|nr:hypothetical protein [Chloracidobacterium sp.]